MSMRPSAMLMFEDILGTNVGLIGLAHVGLIGLAHVGLIVLTHVGLIGLTRVGLIGLAHVPLFGLAHITSKLESSHPSKPLERLL